MIKNYKIIVLILITLTSNILFAYKPPICKSCARIQSKLLYAIKEYYNKENRKIEPILPRKEFENIYNIVLEKKYLKKTIEFYEKECSYGITIISGEPKIYCRYHGNSENCSAFGTMSANNYFSPTLELGFFIFIGCLVLSFLISCIKMSFRVIKKNK